MFADCVIVPTKLRQAVLKQLHSRHQGINRMKAIAHSVVYWPNIDTDREHTIKKVASNAWKHRKIHFGLFTHTGPTQSDHGLGCTLILLALSMALFFW